MKRQNSKTPNKLKSKLGQPKKYLTGKGEHINKGKSAILVNTSAGACETGEFEQSRKCAVNHDIQSLNRWLL